jgi:hypothetical protein
MHVPISPHDQAIKDIHSPSIAGDGSSKLLASLAFASGRSAYPEEEEDSSFSTLSLSCAAALCANHASFFRRSSAAMSAIIRGRLAVQVVVVFVADPTPQTKQIPPPLEILSWKALRGFFWDF